MSKAETLRQLAAASNERHVERLATQIETLRQARLQSVEELAAMLEPLAQAMAALTDETRQTLAEIDRKAQAQMQSFNQIMAQASAQAKAAAGAMSRAAEQMEQRAERQMTLSIVLGAVMGGAVATLMTALWLWLAPPTVHLDTRAVAVEVAKHLKTGPQKQSGGK